MGWVWNSHFPSTEFVEVSPKNKGKLLDEYKSAFEKDQKKYDELFKYEATCKKVVKTLP